MCSRSKQGDAAISPAASNSVLSLGSVSSSHRERTLHSFEEIDRLIGCLIESPTMLGQCIQIGGQSLVDKAKSLSISIRQMQAEWSKSPSQPSQPAKPCTAFQEPQKSACQLEPDHLPPLPQIKDQNLLKATFTLRGMQNEHVSIAKDNTVKESSYDRLEILGDAYLEVIATRLIWDMFRTLPAGRISQIRESLVKNETLASFASKYQFDRRASISEQLVKESPKKWTKIKGDIFEAYVAAVILTNPLDGYEQAKAWLTSLWLPSLQALQNSESSHIVQAKQELAKKVLAKGIRLAYIEEKPSQALEGGMQTWFIGVYLTGYGWKDQHLGSGQGLSKGSAGNQAALAALKNNELLDEVVRRRLMYIEQQGLEEAARALQERSSI